MNKNDIYLINVDGRTVKITLQEKVCIELLCIGYSTKAIARKLKLSPRTVEYYLKKIRSKLNCDKKLDLILLFSHAKWNKIIE